MKNYFKIGGIVVGALALLIIVTGFSYGWRWVAAPISGAVDAREQLESGRSRISKYNHFFNLCQEIQSTEDKINNTYQQIKTTTDEDWKNKLRRNLNGLKNQRSDLARQYNADVSKEYTKARFKSSKLPWSVSTTYEPGGEKCDCNLNQL